MVTTSATDAADYSPDRHTALYLVNTGRIVSTGAIPRRDNGVELAPGVFAALLWLCSAGYVELRLPQAGNPAVVRDWPARLTVAGLQTLTRFRQVHGPGPRRSGPEQATITSPVPRA